MPIQSTEIQFRKSFIVNNDGSNGGRMGSNKIVSGVKNNIFPDVPKSERDAGSTTYRKVYINIANLEGLDLKEAKIFMDKHTDGDDGVVFIPGTFTDTQADIIATAPRQYGAGSISSDVTAGANSLAVTLDFIGADNFIAGDEIRVSDMDGLDGAGNEEYHIIQAVSSDTVTATITLDGSLANDYLAGSVVSSVYQAGDISKSVVNLSVNSTLGEFDNVSYPIIPNAVGVVHESIVLSFTSPTAFNVTGDVSGSMGSGTIYNSFLPINQSNGAEYFKLDFLAFGGTFEAGDSVTFDTLPSALPIWYVREVPSGSAVIGSSGISLSIMGESY